MVTTSAHATTPTSPDQESGHGTLSCMSVPARAEGAVTPAIPATVTHLRHPLDPSPEETQARKDRRRMDAVTYTRARSGTYRARYFNTAGCDAYGHTVTGTYQEDQAIMSSPSPFTAPTTQEPTMSRVTVYSKPACVQCNATYRALTKKGIAYDVVDVTEDEAALTHVLALGYQQVPVVEHTHDVEGLDQHWSGYHPDHITTLAAALSEVTV